MKNNLLSEKLIYTGDSLTPTHIHLCTYKATEMQESSADTLPIRQSNIRQCANQLVASARFKRYGNNPRDLRSF